MYFYNIENSLGVGLVGRVFGKVFGCCRGL